MNETSAHMNEPIAIRSRYPQLCHSKCITAAMVVVGSLPHLVQQPSTGLVVWNLGRGCCQGLARIPVRELVKHAPCLAVLHCQGLWQPCGLQHLHQAWWHQRHLQVPQGWCCLLS